MNADPAKHDQKAKLFHKFKLDWVFPNLTAKLIKDNQDVLVILKTKARVNSSGITRLRFVQGHQLKLSEASDKIATFKSNSEALIVTHQDMPNASAIDGTKKKIEPWFKYGSQYDLQRLFHSRISGMNDARFFFKTDGAWTGLCAENCLLSSFNFNVGPGTSEWTFLSYADCTKLMELAIDECDKQKKKALRHSWQHCFYSDEVLSKNGIGFEKVLQEPGEAVFVAGNSLYQVVNRGKGLNIAWNVCPFTFENIDNIMTGYRLERTELERMPQVPVLRVIHSLLADYRQFFDDTELARMAYFLSIYLAAECQDEIAADKSCQVHKNKLALQLPNKLPYNCCTACCALFYLSTFAFKKDQELIYLCAKCFTRQNTGQDVTKFAFCNIKAVCDMVDSIIRFSQGTAPKVFCFGDCRYLQTSTLHLVRFDDRASELTTMQLIAALNKKDFLEEQLFEQNQKIQRRIEHDIHNKDMNVADQLKKRIRDGHAFFRMVFTSCFKSR